MNKYLLILTLSLISIFILGCEEQQCPETHCEPCEEPLIELEEDLLTIHKIGAGTEVFVVYEVNHAADIIGCGNTAHGPVTLEKIKEIVYKNDLELNHLIIPNTNKENIGGCKDLLKDLYELKKISIYSEWKDTQEFKDLISWAPEEKTEWPEGEYGLYFEHHKIYFDRIDSEIIETNGIDYKAI